METYFYVCGNGDCYRNIFWRRWFTYYKTKKSKAKKEENVNFTVKTIPGDGHCIVNCFSMFFGKDSSEILSLLWNEFQENSHLYMVFSEYNSTEELLKSLEEYIFNKRYNHDTVDLVFEALSKNVRHRVFIFKESLTNSPRGIVGEKYSRCTNVSKKDVKKLTTGYIILILVQFCCVIWRAVRESNNFFSHKILFWYNIILFLSTWNTFLCYISTFFSKPSYFLCNVKLFISTQNYFSCNTKFLFCTSFGMLCLDDILLLSHSNKNIFTCEKINKLSFLCDTKKIISFFLRHHFFVFSFYITHCQHVDLLRSGPRNK